MKEVIDLTWNQLRESIKINDLPKCKLLLINNIALLEEKDEYGNTPLHLAVLCKHEHIVELIISIKPNLIDIQNDSQDSAFATAMRLGHKNTCQKFIDRTLFGSILDSCIQVSKYIPIFLLEVEQLIAEYCRPLSLYFIEDISSIIYEYIINSKDFSVKKILELQSNTMTQKNPQINSFFEAISGIKSISVGLKKESHLCNITLLKDNDVLSDIGINTNTDPNTDELIVGEVYQDIDF